jgi:uncharacterized protein involved in exopolysaccharide biosynthesis
MPQPGLIKGLEISTQVLRNWWTLVAGVCLGLSGSIVALEWLPELYQAKTKILVAPQKIPQDYVRSTVNADLTFRLSALQEAVLSKPYLEELIDLAYPDHVSEEERERLIRTIRDRMQVSVSTYKVGRDERAGYFEIAYRDTKPERCARVVNFLARRYIQENMRFRTSRAEETTTTLKSLAERVRKELEDREQQITEYRAEHLYETPEQLQANLQLLEARRQELEVNQEALQSAREDLRLLEQRVDESAKSSSTARSLGGAAETYRDRLLRLEGELENLRTRYRDEHPAVKAKKRELQRLLSGSVRGESDSSNPDSDREDAVSDTLADERVQEKRQEIDRLEKDRARIQEDIAKYQERIEATPKVQQRLSELTKGLEVLQNQYNSYQAKVQEATSSELIEQSQKGEQFELLEEATVPTLPVSPDPMMVLLMGLPAGLALFVGPLVLKGLILAPITSEAGLEVALGVPALVSIPRLSTRGVRRRKVMRGLLNAVLASAAIAILIVVIVEMPSAISYLL